MFAGKSLLLVFAVTVPSQRSDFPKTSCACCVRTNPCRSLCAVPTMLSTRPWWRSSSPTFSDPFPVSRTVSQVNPSINQSHNVQKAMWCKALFVPDILRPIPSLSHKQAIHPSIDHIMSRRQCGALLCLCLTFSDPFPRPDITVMVD